MMREKALDSIVSLYAIVAVFRPGKGYTILTNILEVYLNSCFSRQTTEQYLEAFKSKIRAYENVKAKGGVDFDHFLENEVVTHTHVVSRAILSSQRMLALVYLIGYLPYISGRFRLDDSDEVVALLKKISGGLLLSPDDFSDAMAFSGGQYHLISARNPVTIVTSNQAISISGVRTLHVDGLEGQLIFTRISMLDTILFKVDGDANLAINGRKLFKRHTCILERGAVIYRENGNPIFYNDIYKSLVKSQGGQKLILETQGVGYIFSNGVYGLHQTSLKCESGELVAIMGGSGSGKTTLMNLLIGARKPSFGTVTINNLDLCTNPAMVKGYIGYVPQDDALNEDLTAFDNLYYITGLASASLSHEGRVAMVDSLLNELNLSTIRDLRVGNPLDKIISGGQRKRLNIAISIISDPGILFLDEPTSGLSSADSQNIMQLLKELTLKDRLVVVNIHQPSSDVFKLFDKLLFIDQGGYPIYFGPPVQVIPHLKSTLKLVDVDESECHACGNISPDQIFDLVDTRHVENEVPGNSSRLFTPLRWHRKYLRVIANKPGSNDPVPALKQKKLDIPNRGKQYLIYSARNFFTKVADLPYLTLSLTLSPLLALLLSVFTRYISNPPGNYSYHYNENIPAFIFMSIIVAMFVGIMEGSSEIIKDRKALKRETFLDLSFAAYVFSKFSWLAGLSALQMGAYVLISARILEIPAGNLLFFLVMWAVAIWANLMGLLLSAVFKTMASVYVSIPFFLIPQILFSGAVIDFNKVHPIFSSERYVPPVSEVMVSRWAYEAINVGLFMNSYYAREFYQIDRQISKTGYHRNFLLPEVEKAFFGQTWSSDHYLTLDSDDFHLVKNGVAKLGRFMGKDYTHLHRDTIRGSAVNNFARELRTSLGNRMDSLQTERDMKITRLGNEEYQRLRLTSNSKLTQVVTDETNFQKVKIAGNEFIRKLGPVYHEAENPWGRSHLYAPAKNIAGHEVPATRFNLVIIWLMSLACLGWVLRLKPKF